MREERFFCDRCKQQVPRQDALKLVVIRYNRPDDDGDWAAQDEVGYDLCFNCAEKLGAVKQFKKKDEPIVKPVPDLKDRLFDIIVELVNFRKEE